MLRFGRLRRKRREVRRRHARAKIEFGRKGDVTIASTYSFMPFASLRLRCYVDVKPITREGS